ADVHTITDCHSLTSTVVHLPCSKASPLGPGEDIYWSDQMGITDPGAAYLKHLQYNDPPHDEHIFTYPHKGSFQPSHTGISWTL
ncbi:hypothetical protein P691DRAFT_830953, partial [Macrolepiota fuliginosa MF-IS2]